MTSGSLIDLDPPPDRVRRWPFYVASSIGAIALGAILSSRLPAPVAQPSPSVTEAPAAATAQPLRPQFRVAPPPIAPARP